MDPKILIQEIQEKARLLGRTPKKSECAGSDEAVQIFGSWKNALAAAGFPYQSQIPLEKIKEEFEQKRKELGRLPTMQEFQPHCQILYKKYGSWEKALNAMGYPSPLSKKALKKEVFDFVKKNGRSPKITELEHGSAVARKIGGGSYNQALRILGLASQTAHGSTKEDLIELLQNKAKELGRSPVFSDLEQNTTIMRRFGSWNNALKAAGLPVWKKTHNSHIHLSNQELLSDIQILILKNPARKPYFREYRHAGLCVKRFGKWSTAVEKAQEDPYHTMEAAKAMWEKQLKKRN